MGISSDLMRAVREENTDLIRILEDDEQDRENERSEARNYLEPSFDPTIPNTETDWEKFFNKEPEQEKGIPTKRGSLPSFEEYLAFCTLMAVDDAVPDSEENEAPPMMYA